MEAAVATIVAALIGLAGGLAAQAFSHRRWTREQDTKRAELLETLAQERRAEAEEQARQRRAEQTETLERMAEQTNSVIDNALKLAEAHQGDAEKARLLALETAQSHTECRAEVAHLAGQVAELRARITETERTSGYEHRIGEQHRDLKHRALNALTVAEGYVALVQKLVPKCTCHAFDALDELTNTIQPQVAGLLAENQRIAGTTTVEGAPT